MRAPSSAWNVSDTNFVWVVVQSAIGSELLEQGVGGLKPSLNSNNLARFGMKDFH
jgi:hypothetical protein